MKLELQTECLNSGIFIIDGLKDDDMQTARRLFEDIDTYKGYSSTPSIEYKKVTTREELLIFLEEIKEYCRKGGFPTLHFEVHGDKEGGIYVGNAQENVTWPELVGILRDINILSHNNLGVVLAGCHGLYAVTEIDALKPTPFYFLVACERAIGSGELEENVANFYRKLFDGNSLSEAMKVVESKLPTFLAEKEFIAAMIGYFREQARGKGKDRRTENTITKWVNLNPGHTEEEFKAFRARVKEFYKPSIEEFYRNADIFLHGRYSVNADDVLRFLETLKGSFKPREHQR